MNRVILGALIAAACAAATTRNASAADGYDDTGAWYVSALGQYTLLDDKRVSKDNVGFQIGLGYDFAPYLAGEIAVGAGSFRVKGSGASEKLATTSLDVLYKLAPVTSMFRPYVIVGAGGMSDNIGRVSANHDQWLAEAGVGLLTGLGSQSGSTRLQFRTEAKYRYEFVRNAPDIPNNPRDVVFGVGLQLMFGAPTPPPPIARALPPPAPESALTPPPPPPPPPPEPCHAPAGFQVDANCRIIEQTLVVRAVDFEFNSSRLTEPARETLDEVGAALQKQPDMQVEIQGYTDSIGADAYNLNLSQKRAAAVKAYLVSKGLSDTSLTAKGYGKVDPIASNATKEGRAQNRRVAFAVTNAPAHVTVVTKDATDASTEAAEKTDPTAVKPKQ
jgi:OOP family OmpA-OmpF porin